MYSSQEVKEILIKLNQQDDEVKYKKFEKLGIASAANINNNNNYICDFCKKHLLSSHLLDLHVAESHDTFFELQKSKKPSFQCFLEACQYISNDPNERKNHCISSHKFPHDFSFEKPQEKKPDAEKKKKSPVFKHKNFHFGHKSQKSFKSGSETKIDMKELMDVLPDTTS